MISYSYVLESQKDKKRKKYRNSNLDLYTLKAKRYRYPSNPSKILWIYNLTLIFNS